MSRRTRLLPRFYRYMLESDASTHRKGTALNVLSGLLTGVGLAIMMPAAVALQTDSRYLALDQARKMNDKDEELQDLIGQFNLARMDLNNEISKAERDDARVAELNEKVNTLYGQIMNDEGMIAYNEAKRECEALVNYIDAIINTAMNGGDPMTVQEPSASCTGSCSTCGGCH